jgi:hypothetical protein
MLTLYALLSLLSLSLIALAAWIAWVLLRRPRCLPPVGPGAYVYSFTQITTHNSAASEATTRKTAANKETNDA